MKPSDAETGDEDAEADILLPDRGPGLPPGAPPGLRFELLEDIQAQIEGDLAGAETRLRALLEARPEDASAWLLQASLCLRRSGFEELEQAARKALALAPGDPRALYFLASAQVYQGNPEAAAATLRRLVDIEPNWNALCRLAVCQHRLGRLESALRSYRRALNLAPLDQPSLAVVPRFGLMSVLRDLGRGPEADAEASGLLALYQRRPLLTASGLIGFFNRMDFPEWDRFRKKQELCALIEDYRREKGAAAFPYHPRSYVMPGDHAAFLRDAREARSAASGSERPIWIVKPTALFGGQGMRLIDDPAALAAEEDVVVQDYLAEPYLLGGRKAHLRLYLLVTSVAPLRAWFWRDGLVRFAPEPYRRGPGWLDRQDMHITNTALHKGHPGIELSQDPAVEDSGTVWSLRAYLRHIEAAGGDTATLWRELERLALGLARVIEHSGLFARQADAPAPRAYPPKFIGLDVLLDEKLRPWLLEAQRMPGQTGTPLIEAINGRLYRTILSMTAAPLGTPSPASWPAREAALEFARRGDFLRLIPQSRGAARDFSTI